MQIEASVTYKSSPFVYLTNLLCVCKFRHSLAINNLTLIINMLAQPAFDYSAERHCAPAEVRTEKVSAHLNTPRGAVQRLMQEYGTALQAADSSQPPYKAPKKDYKQPHVGIMPSNGNTGLKNADIPVSMPTSYPTRASGTLVTQHFQKISVNKEGRQAARAPKMDELIERLARRGVWTNDSIGPSGCVTPDQATTDFHLSRNLKEDLRRAKMIQATADKQTRINTAYSMGKPELSETNQRGKFLDIISSVRAQLVMHLTSMINAKKAVEIERRSLRSNKGEFLDDREPVVYEEPVDILQETPDWMLDECDAWGEQEEDELNVLMERYPEAGVEPLSEEEVMEEIYADLLTPEGEAATHIIDWAKHPEMQGVRISSRIQGHELEAQL